MIHDHKIYIRKSKKVDGIMVTHKYKGKMISRVLYEPFETFEKPALVYAMLLVNQFNALFIDLINKSVTSS
jgi:hypothetical protein